MKRFALRVIERSRDLVRDGIEGGGGWYAPLWVRLFPVFADIDAII